jgi:hypothetical protein
LLPSAAKWTVQLVSMAARMDARASLQARAMAQ